MFNVMAGLDTLQLGKLIQLDTRNLGVAKYQRFRSLMSGFIRTPQYG